MVSNLMGPVLCFIFGGLIFGEQILMAQATLEEIKTCPASPNCISSLTSSKKHFMEPWSYNGDKSAILETIKEKVLKQDRVKLVSSDEDSLHFIFTSRIMRFKDDVWFYFDDEKKLVHFKSASRTGRSDFGINRDRMNTLYKIVF